jgi:hypothetical protein
MRVFHPTIPPLRHLFIFAQPFGNCWLPLWFWPLLFPQLLPGQSDHRVAFGPDPPRVATPSSVAVDPSSPNPRLLQATQRNLARVEEANLTDTVTIGKLGYLTADPAFYFAAPVKGPDDSFGAPDWFLNELRTIACTPSQSLTKPPFGSESAPTRCRPPAIIILRHPRPARITARHHRQLWVRIPPSQPTTGTPVQTSRIR